jgi:hypothetical protein
MELGDMEQPSVGLKRAIASLDMPCKEGTNRLIDG